MNYIPLIIVMAGCAVILYPFLFYKIMKQSDKFHNTLDTLKEKAISATTKEDLEILSVEINKIFPDSWNTSEHPRIIEVRTIVATKYEMLKLFNKKK